MYCSKRVNPSMHGCIVLAFGFLLFRFLFLFFSPPFSVGVLVLCDSM